MPSNNMMTRSTVAAPDRRFWGYAGTEYKKSLKGIYSIGIIDLEKLDIYSQGDIKLNPAHDFFSGSQPALYQFTTPPQSYEIVEPPATNIVATQDGGKFIESHGSIFKDIRISGTVGFRPAPPSKELFPGLAQGTGVSITIPSIFQQKDNRGLDPKEVTGFDEIIFLRNIFRLYFDLKEDPTMARKIAMIWIYMKEGEAWIVEPLNFATTRDRSSPLSWAYSITLKTLYMLESTFTYPTDPVSLFKAFNQLWSNIKGIAEAITDAMDAISDTLDFFANLPASIVAGVLRIGSTVTNAVLRMINTGKSFSNDVTQNLLQAGAANAASMRRLLDYHLVNEIEGLNISSWTSGGIGGSPGTPMDPTPLFTGSAGRAREAVTTMERSFKLLLSMDELWKEQRQVQVSDYGNAYKDKRGNTPFNTGSALLPSNIRVPESARQVRIDDITGGIRGLAKIHLGSESKWKIIAVLNDLKSPYVAPVAGDGVLAPGDKMLIPREPSTTSLAMSDGSVSTINPDPDSESLSPVMRKYGRDMKLTQTFSATGTGLADLQITNRGDIDTVEEVPNVEQAMMIKFSTEQGELAIHPTFGARYPIGTKATLVSIQQFAINTRSTFLQDPRVGSIADLQIASDGDQIITSSKLVLTDSDIELPITFAVRG